MILLERPLMLVPVVVVTTLIALTAIPVAAHDPGLSSAVVRLSDGGATAQIIVAAHDLARLVAYDADGDQALSGAELRASQDALKEIGAQALQLRVGTHVAAAPTVELQTAEAGTEVAMRLAFKLPAHSVDEASEPISIHSQMVERMPHGHRHFVRLIDDKGAVLSSQLLHRGSATLTHRMRVDP